MHHFDGSWQLSVVNGLCGKGKYLREADNKTEDHLTDHAAVYSIVRELLQSNFDVNIQIAAFQ